MLLALHSKNPRSGKDTAADHLVEKLGFVKDAFGAEIYNEIAPAFNVTKEQLYSNEWKTIPQAHLALKYCTNTDFVRTVLLADVVKYDSYHDAISAPRTSRVILQRWATEYRRANDVRYWVRKVEDRLTPILEGVDGPPRDIVISDLREIHEFNALRNLSILFGARFRVLEIRMPGTVSNGHSSDAGLPDSCISTIINNEPGKIDEYLAVIHRTATNIRGSK